jgi:DNA-binding response OmpR family regulator
MLGLDGARSTLAKRAYGKRILQMKGVMVVEDDAVFAAAVEDRLKQAGFDVEVAADTMIALSKIEQRHFDFVLVDVGMPQGKPSGLAFARMVRYRHPKAPIIFISGYPEVVEMVTQLPAKVFVKPVDLDEVVAEIEAQLAI